MCCCECVGYCDCDVECDGCVYLGEEVWCMWVGCVECVIGCVGIVVCCVIRIVG